MRATQTAGARSASSAGASLPFARKADRAKAYKAARRHTVLVKALRLVLPTIAIATVGLYVVSAKLSAKFGDVTPSFEKFELSTEDLRMVTPKLEGVTDNNGRYVIRAASGTQKFDAPDIILLDRIDARLTQPNGDWAHLVSDTGRYESKTDKMDLKGNIRVVAQNGMDARLRTARIDIKAQRVLSTEPVRVDMPNGHIDSQSILIDTGAKTINFVGEVRVRLFKRPQKATAEAPKTVLAQ